MAGGERPHRRLAQSRRGRHACRMPRLWILVLVVLLIAALTFFVSRRFGFTLLLLPFIFVWGSPSRD